MVVVQRSDDSELFTLKWLILCYVNFTLINYFLKKKVKKQLTEWEKIFSKHLSDKELVSRIYKQLLQLNNKEQITKSKNWQRI